MPHENLHTNHYTEGEDQINFYSDATALEIEREKEKEKEQKESERKRKLPFNKRMKNGMRIDRTDNAIQIN